MSPRKLAAGNWKMNGMLDDLSEIDALTAEFGDPDCDVLICPPATLIHPMVGRAAGGALAVGGQNCHSAEKGAHTGDISAAQLRDSGCDYVILGHSERRADHDETSQLVAEKAIAAHQAGLITIICVGESEAERNEDQALDVVAEQLATSVPDCANAENCVIAYEPIWAIGTGRTPTIEQISEIHDLLRQKLDGRFADGSQFRLLYGGSVKPANAAEIFAVNNVDGALVGGASLKAKEFGGIISALEKA